MRCYGARQIEADPMTAEIRILQITGEAVEVGRRPRPSASLIDRRRPSLVIHARDESPGPARIAGIAESAVGLIEVEEPGMAKPPTVETSPT